ncbi:MAG: Mn-dependent transcriptional regulator [Fusobacteria bacterium]|nr:MAG: Mn-dependent transcriptional regulator [Fusobacteriota bacterium]KAF0230258.1 MAG: Mn-dependent transcriptional [Fusobacteriota bacterium]
MIIHESEENYLETIFLLYQIKGYVRSIDIAAYLHFSKPSVSRAIKNLKEKEFISVDENGMINLTEQGKEKAECIYERHKVLSDILISFGVEKELAIADACKIEHVISQKSFDKIKEYFNIQNDKK